MVIIMISLIIMMIGMQMVAAESMMMMMMTVMKAMCVCHDEEMVTAHQSWKKKINSSYKIKNKNHTCAHYACMKGRDDLHILTGLEDRRVVEQKHIIMKTEKKQKNPAHSNHV